MRTALASVIFAALTAWALNAQQEPPKPPGGTPPAQEKPEAKPEAKPADPDGKATDGGEAKAGGPKVPSPTPERETKAADPASMAAPKPGDVKKMGGPVDERTYVLGARDVIAITVLQDPSFTGQHTIRPDGRITLNLIGEVQAAGLTPEDLGKLLKEKIEKFMVDPDITVNVLSVNSKFYYIQGEVNKPGEYPLLVPTKVLQALVNAGGIRDFGNEKDIVIMREDSGKTTRYHFNYKNAIKGKDLDKNIFLQAGDILIVK
jgi:polysaccharide export outer membrane protein